MNPQIKLNLDNSKSGKSYKLCATSRGVIKNPSVPDQRLYFACLHGLFLLSLLPQADKS